MHRFIDNYRFVVLMILSALLFVTMQCLALDGGETHEIAIINGYLIDGTGGKPLEDAIVLIRDEIIAAVGKKGQLTIPEGAKIIDAQGGAVLPGFINTHVHNGYNEANLKAWASGGVTTIRDEAMLGDPVSTLKLRDTVLNRPEYARIVSASPMMTKTNGYGQLYINSPEEAKQKTNELIDIGIDAIKVSLEDGYAGQRNLPKLTEEELFTIVNEAHQRGLPVSGHITQARYQEMMVRAGVDDIAHVAYDFVSDELIADMVAKGIYWIPTFTVFRNFGVVLDDAVANLKSFVAAGGRVALGNDFGGGPGEFELGIPMYELLMMRRAGMTPMQIILASTRNAAHVCRREKTLGTIESGKIADVLIVDGNPLKELKALSRIKYVFKDGTPIVTPH